MQRGLIRNGMGSYTGGTGAGEDDLMFGTNWSALQAGVFGYASLKATQNGAGADMSIDVSAGRALIANSAYVENNADGDTRFWAYVSSETENLAISSNTAGSTRIDILVVQFDTGALPGDRAVDVAVLEIVEGIAGAGAPATPANALKLAEISVANGATSITNANITDSRVWIGWGVQNELAISGIAPLIRLQESDASADNKNWQFAASSEALAFTIWNDTYTVGSEWLSVQRTGTTIDRIRMYAAIVIGTDAAMPSSETKLWINNSGPSVFRITGDGNSVYLGADINEPFIGTVNNVALRITTNSIARWAFLNDGIFRPIVDNTYSIGVGAFRPSVIYAGTGTINTSDLDKKNLKDFAIDSEKFFDDINVIAYTWKDAKKEVIDEDGVVTYVQKDEDEKRTHVGYGAQHVIAAIESQGLTAMDFAGYVEDESGKGLRSDEVLALLQDGAKKKLAKQQAFIEAIATHVGFDLDSVEL